MYLIVVYCFFFFTFIIVAQRKLYTLNNILTLVFITICIFLFSSRSEYSPDTIPYMLMYNDPTASLRTIWQSNAVEPFYLYMNLFFNSIGIPFRIYLALMISLMFISWYFFTRTILKTNYLFPSLFIFYSYFGIFYYGIVLRNAISISITFIAILCLLKYKGVKRFLFFYILLLPAVLIHNSMIIYGLVPILLYSHPKNWLLYLIVFSSFIFINFNLSSYFIIIENILNYFKIGRFSSYLDGSKYYINSNYSLHHIKFFILAIIFIYFRKHITPVNNYYDFFLKLYIVGIFIFGLFYGIVSAGRLANVFLIFEFILISMIYNRGINGKYKSQYVISILIFSLLNFIGLLHSTPLLLKY